jgi:hypothetical protein
VDDRPSPDNSGPELNGFGPRRRSTVRFVLSIAVAVAAAFALYVLQPSWFTAPAVAGPRGGPRAVPSPTPTPRPPVPHLHYLGQQQSVDNVAITPLAVTYTRGSGADAANKGYVYAIVTLLIVNHRGQDYGFVPNVTCPVQYCNFYVRDGQGEKNPPTPYDPYHTRLRAVVLQDGGLQEGSLTFEVPERDVKTHRLQLLYYHDPFGDANGVVHWELRYPPHHGR